MDAVGRVSVRLVDGPLDGVSTVTVPSWFFDDGEALRPAGHEYRYSGDLDEHGRAVFAWVAPAERPPELTQPRNPIE